MKVLATFKVKGQEVVVVLRSELAKLSGAGLPHSQAPGAPSFYARIGKLSSVIFALPSCMAVGWLLGHFVVDRFLPTSPWGTVVFVLLGAGAGFYEVIRILMADQGRKNG